MSDDTREPNEADETAEAADAPVIDVADWFGDRREVWLELDGVRYRLRITRRNKLILQK
jgi:hemin uptake protein HemP